MFAILPRVTSAGIEARSYALSAALAVWVTVVFVVAVRRRTGTTWVLYALLVAVSTTVFLYSILIVAAHVVTLAVTKTGRRCVGSFVLAAGVGIAIAAPVIVLVQSQADQVSWIAGRNFDLVWIVLVEQYFDNALPVAVVSGLLVVAGVTVGIVRGRDRRDGDQAGLLATAVPWLVVPTALVLLYSLTSQNVYLGRYFTFTAPACALLLGQSMVWIAGLAGRRSLPLLAVILALFGAIALPHYIVQRGPYAKPSGMDYSRVADLVESGAAPGDCVLYDLKNVWNPGPMRTVETVDPPAFAALRDISRGSTAAELGELWDETLAPDRIADQIRSCPAIWLLTDRSAGSTATPGRPSIPVIRWRSAPTSASCGRTVSTWTSGGNSTSARSCTSSGAARSALFRSGGGSSTTTSCLGFRRVGDAHWRQIAASTLIAAAAAVGTMAVTAPAAQAATFQDTCVTHPEA